MRKLFKKIILTIVIVLAALFVGLIINNRVFYVKFNHADTKKDYLSEKDISRIHEIFKYLCEKGNNIFTGFDGNGSHPAENGPILGKMNLLTNLSIEEQLRIHKLLL